MPEDNPSAPQGEMPEGVTAQIVITLTDTQQIMVGGPIENKTLCYGMLEVAKDAIREHAAKKESRIVQPMTLPGGLRPV